MKNPFPTRTSPASDDPVSLDKCWSLFSKAWGMSLLWENGLVKQTVPQAESVRKVLEAIEKHAPLDAWSLDDSVAFLVMSRPGNHEHSALMAHQMSAHSQPPRLALEALLKSLHIGYSRSDCWMVFNQDGPPCLPATSNCWAPLRILLSRLDRPTYEDCLTLASGRFEGASLLEKNCLAFLFPDQDWWRTAAEATLSQAVPDQLLPGCGEALLASAQDFEVVTRLLQNRSYPPPADYAWSVARRFGARSTGLLLAAARHLKDWASPLFDIDQPEVATGLAQALAQNNLRASIHQYFQKHPLLAQAALQPVARGKSKAAPLAQALLDSLGPTDSVPDLASGVPNWLESPPWHAKRAKGKPTSIDNLVMPDYPARLLLPTPQPAATFAGELEVRPSVWADCTQRLRSGLALDPKWLDYLSDEQLTLIFQRAHPGQWPTGIDYSPVLVRLGLDSLPALEMLAYQDLTECLRLLLFIDSPKAAGLAAAGLSSSAYRRKLAARWLEKFPLAAAIGLIPRALGPVGEERSEAELALRQLPRDVVEQAALGTAAENPIKAFLAEPELHRLPAKIPRLPDFCAPDRLPRLTTQQGATASLQVSQSVLEMLAFSPTHFAYAGLADARQILEAASLEEFSWQLLLRWLLAGAPVKEKWAATSLVHFAGPASARRLAQLIIRETALQKGDLGLSILFEMTTPVAFFQLCLLSSSSRPLKGLQARAAVFVEEFARLQEWTPKELQERSTPDFGFDEAGRLSLQLGGEAHEAFLNERLEIEWTGGGQGKQAGAWLQAARLDLAAALPVQRKRLEEAMIGGRRWSEEEFTQLIASHPVLSRLARDLVWGHYQTGELIDLFLLEERPNCPDGLIGVVHPLHLSDDQLQLWKARPLQPPFLQMHRQVVPVGARLADIEERWSRLDIFAKDIPGLEKSGWREHGFEPDECDSLVRRFCEGQVVRLDLAPGFKLHRRQSSMEQELGRIEFADREGQPQPLEKDPVLFSEVYVQLIAWLDSVQAKA